MVPVADHGKSGMDQVECIVAGAGVVSSETFAATGAIGVPRISLSGAFATGFSPQPVRMTSASAARIVEENGDQELRE